MAEIEHHLSAEFLQDHATFTKEFDTITGESLYTGPRVEEIVKRFFVKHKSEINESLQFALIQGKFPNCKSQQEILDEDLKILSTKLDDLKECATSCQVAISRANILADVYWRASQACYMRCTYNEWKFNQLNDRNEAVQFARYAIRYNPLSFKANFWFMINLGWYLDGCNSIREKTLISRVFRRSTSRCLELDPTQPLALHLTGRFYYNVAGLNWIEKQLASSLLGCEFEDCSYADAEAKFLEAHSMQNDWMPTGLWMAKTLLAQKRPEEEIKGWIDFGLSAECLEPTVEMERNQLIELKANLVKCGKLK